jgi:hypothetical protein
MTAGSFYALAIGFFVLGTVCVMIATLLPIERL